MPWPLTAMYATSYKKENGDTHTHTVVCVSSSLRRTQHYVARCASYACTDSIYKQTHCSLLTTSAAVIKELAPALIISHYYSPRFGSEARTRWHALGAIQWEWEKCERGICFSFAFALTPGEIREISLSSLQLFELDHNVAKEWRL